MQSASSIVPKTYAVTLRMNDGEEIDFDIDAEEVFAVFGEPDSDASELSPAQVADMVGDVVFGFDHMPPLFVRGFIPLHGDGRLRCALRTADISAVIESEAAQVAIERKSVQAQPHTEVAEVATARPVSPPFSGQEGALCAPAFDATQSRAA